MGTPHLNIRPGHPDFLDLPWGESITDWDIQRLVDLPTGVHRHEIVFVEYRDGIYAIKELPSRLARHEWEMLRGLEALRAPVVEPVGVAERPWVDPSEESAAAVITRYVDFAFSYRELIRGAGFGARRDSMLDAIAGLLVELHRAGCFWGDCSLSNVLYRWDAAAVEVLMVDAETAELHSQLTDGQRAEDLEIMVLNLAGGMADIAAEQGIEVEDADLFLGEDVVARYEGLWAELTADVVIGPDERYRIAERIDRLNDLGFEVEDVELVPVEGGGRLRLHAVVGGRNFHSDRLRELTQIQASENQARQILSDLLYYEATHPAESPAGKTVAAIRWRVGVFEPLLARIRDEGTSDVDPIQRYCDFLHHRFLLSSAAGRDIGTDEALEQWLAAGQPGYQFE